MATNSSSEGGSAAALIPDLFPSRKPMTPEQISAGVQAALNVQRRAVTFGKRPFAAVLLGPDNETVLLTHQSIDQVNHAESSLARLAYTHYSKEFLWQCTLVSTWEPKTSAKVIKRCDSIYLSYPADMPFANCNVINKCGMCTATIYWAHIGRIVFAGTNDQLYELTGPGNKENFTMDWHTRDFLKGCPQKDVEVIGPLEEEGKIVMEESDKYWCKTRSNPITAPS